MLKDENKSLNVSRRPGRNPQLFGRDVSRGSRRQTATSSCNFFFASIWVWSRSECKYDQMRFWWWPERQWGWEVIRRNDITGENKVQWLHLFPLAYYWSTEGKRALSFLFLHAATGRREPAGLLYSWHVRRKNNPLRRCPLRVLGWFRLHSFVRKCL